MAEIDIVVPKITVQQKAIIDVKELYSLIKKFALDKGYNLAEENYKQEGETTKVDLEAFRDVDDYTRYIIKISIATSDLKEVETRKKILYEGVIELEFEARLKRDYEGTWEKKPIHRIMRGFFDKYVMKGKFDNYASELKDETYLLMEQVRSFLRLPKPIA